MNGDAIAIIREIGDMRAEIKEDIGEIKTSIATSLGAVSTRQAELQGDFEGFRDVIRSEVETIKAKQKTDDWRHWLTAVAIPSLSYALNRQVYVRPLNKKNPKEFTLFIEWLHKQRGVNRYNPQMFQKEQVAVFTCFNKKGIIGFIDISVALMIEHVAFKPELSDLQKAEMLVGVQHYMVSKCSEKNIPNAFFRASDEHFSKFAQHLGWREVRERLLNLHLLHLEGADEEAIPT
jgi:hypothetical protein